MSAKHPTHAAHDAHAGHGHDHGHDHHDHDHSHGGHSHAPANFDRAFAIGIAANTAFVAIEAYYGWHVNSLALLADAGHNLGDVAGLLLAWGAAMAARMKPAARYTYGWKRASILAAFANATLLLVAMGSLAWEAIGRLGTPEPMHGVTVMAVAGVGIFVNLGTALMFMRGRHDDINVRGAFLHMAGDALVSFGVVVAGALALWLGWSWLDPVVSLAIAAVIVAGTWGLLRQSLHLMFDGVPAHIDIAAVRLQLESLPGVSRVHDLHVWATGSADVLLTAHLVMPAGHPDDAFLEAATLGLRDKFRIGHVTLQVVREPFMALCDAPPVAPTSPARPVPHAPHAHHGHSH